MLLLLLKILEGASPKGEEADDYGCGQGPTELGLDPGFMTH